MEKSKVSKPKQKVELSTLHAMAPQQDPVITPKEGRVQSKKLDATPAMGTEDLTQLAADPDANKPLVVRYSLPKLSNGFSHGVFNRQKLLHRDCNCLILLHVFEEESSNHGRKSVPLLNCPKNSMSTCQKLLQLK